MMLCARCNTENPTDASFCEQCGSKLELVCPTCKTTLNPGARFCKKCGAALGATTPASARESNYSPIRVTDASAPETLDGERKTVTALFADIKGSMDLMEDLDPEEARAIVDPALKLMMDAVHHYGGYVAQSTGDGIFAMFGAPVAHEDHPQRALYAALRMQESMKRYAEKLRAEQGVNLQVRVGVNSGEMVVRTIATGEGKTDYTPIGHSTSLAARLQALANPGSIAISEAVRKLVEGYFVLKPLGPARIKGASEPVSVYEVSGLGPLRTRLQRSASRGYTKFVGRQREMDAMKHAAEQAKAGHGQIVAAMGEPGVGKSRLFFEFKAVSQSGWMVLETVSVSHEKASAYLPAIDLLHSYFRISNDDDLRTRREKVNGRVLTLDRALENTLPFLLRLLGVVEGDDPLAQMDGQVKKRRTLDAIKSILLRESLNQPLMVIFEDLHWIDDETQEFLNLLTDSIGTAKILLLVNYRPEYSHGWGSKTYYTQLRLDPLGRESADEMLSARLGDLQELAPLKRLVLERTEGNPLFIEELVEALFEDGVLVKNGTVKVTRSLGQLKIPPTVQGILAARIDRLPSDTKELLQTLAVIGMGFPLSLVRQIVQLQPEQLDHMLSSLQAGEFLYEQPAVGDVQYTFKHALTHEVAYKSVLVERRKVLHKRTAEAIESIYADRLDDQVGELAHHYDRSGEVPKSIEYLGRAGLKASAQAAQLEAISYFTRALQLIEKLADNESRARRELDLQMALAAAAHVAYSGGAPAREAALSRAQQLCEKLGDGSRLTEVKISLAVVYFLRRQFPEAQRLAEESLKLASRLNDSLINAAAHATLGLTLYCKGQFSAAREHYEDSIRLFGPRAPSSFGQVALAGNSAESILGMLLAPLGYPDSARARLRSALVESRRGSDPFKTSVALAPFCVTEVELRDPLAAEALTRELSVIASEYAIPAFRSAAMLIRAWIMTFRQQADEGIDQLQRLLAASESPAVVVSVMKVALAEAFARRGKLRESLATIEDGLADPQRNAEAEFHRVKGEVLLLGVPRDEGGAERAFRDAIDIARSQAARLYELRATTDLARLLATQGRRNEVRAMLAEIYNWFTEGFDTADLKDAKALLEQLSS